MTVQDETAWVCVAIHGKPRPFVHSNTVRDRRKASQECIASAFTHPGEAFSKGWISKGWKRAYRKGWRCVRVIISIKGDQS